MRPAGRWQIRPFVAADRAGVDGLLDAGADRIWRTQGHRLHGEASDGERWRRTLVAERSGRIVGAVTVAANRVHPGRYNLAVEVAAGDRRHGLARALVEQARVLTPLPLAGKLRPADPAGQALLRAVGGRSYQHCPGLCPDPTAAAVRGWVAGVPVPSDLTVRPLSELPSGERVELWVRQYLWVHRDWSPAAEGPLRELAHELVREADPESSAVAVRNSRVVAVCWVFDAPDGTAELVCETAGRSTPGGVAAVAACLARSLSLLAGRGIRRAEIDGHAGDPHLSVVLGTFPPVPCEPLDLVEIDPVHGPVARQQ